MFQGHPYYSLQVPSDAPFELRPSPGKGWGAFATRRIERGSIIFTEKPLFVIRKPHTEITEGDVWAAFQQLEPRDKEQFLCLRDNGSQSFTSMAEAFAENSFAISRDTWPRSNGTSIHGLFLLHSRFNHSCIPNSKIPSTDKEIITSFATEDIAAGREITFCYNTDFECRPRHERHQALRFICDCKACRTDTKFQQLSDMRRILIRGLQYLTLGVDLNGQKQDMISPIIFDPSLKKAAESSQIPLSARLIYNLFTMVLLEEEGLLDDFMVERLSPPILLISALFKTEGNARIARLAMAQQNWLQKLCVALRLYGRTDIADHAISVELQRQHGYST